MIDAPTRGSLDPMTPISATTRQSLPNAAATRAPDATDRDTAATSTGSSQGRVPSAVFSLGASASALVHPVSLAARA